MPLRLQVTRTIQEQVMELTGTRGAREAAAAVPAPEKENQILPPNDRTRVPNNTVHLGALIMRPGNQVGVRFSQKNIAIDEGNLPLR